MEFSLSRPERLYLSVFDAQGQLVRRLIAGNIVPEGTFQVVWDGKDATGKALPDGVYWYAIQGETGRTKTGKIMLLH